MTSETTKKQYILTYLYLVKKAKSETLNTIFEYIRTSKVKDTTKINYLNSIIGLKKQDANAVKGDLSNIIGFRDDLNSELKENRSDDNLTKKQRMVVEKVSLQDIDAAIEKLNREKNTDPKALESYVLFRLMYPQPLRNDLMEILVSKSKGALKDLNSIYLPSKKDGIGIISIVDHKTSHEGNRRPITKTLNVELTNDIKKLVSDGRKYLFENVHGKPYSSSAFSHKLTSLFKKELGVPFSSTILRKIHHTKKYKKILTEMKDDSIQMGHGLKTIRNVYIDNKCD